MNQQPDRRLNGRLDITGPPIDQFQLFLNPGTNYNENSSYNDALTGNWNDSVLSQAFFSSQNIQIIQNGIRALVFKLSNGRYNIAPQDDTNLKIIMRSIFLQYASNLPHHITEQIISLNQLVYDYAVPNILKEVEAYLKYKRDVSTLAEPMKRPAFSTNKGDKQLEQRPGFRHVPDMPKPTFERMMPQMN